MDLSFDFHQEMQDITVTSQDIALIHRLLASKYLVVVLGMKSDGFPPVNASDLIKGAGVSRAAGIQTFRGAEGLFCQPSKKETVLESFQKDTFEVRQLSPVCHL